MADVWGFESKAFPSTRRTELQMILWLLDRVIPEGALDNAACSSRGVFSDGAPLLIMRAEGCPEVRWAKHERVGGVGKAWE